MNELARTKTEEERDEVVALLRAIADRLHGLSPTDARTSLTRLASPVALLAREAEATIGPFRMVANTDASDPPPARTTVVFVRRGYALGA